MLSQALTRLCTRRMRLMVRVCPGPAAMLCSFLSAISPSHSSSLSLASCSHLSSSLLTLTSQSRPVTCYKLCYWKAHAAALVHNIAVLDITYLHAICWLEMLSFSK